MNLILSEIYRLFDIYTVRERAWVIQNALAAPPPCLEFNFMAQTFSATVLNIYSMPVPSLADTSDQIILFS